MARTYHEDWILEDGREVVIDFTFTPGCPETGPTYACGGTPAEPPEIEIDAIRFDGKEIEVDDEQRQVMQTYLLENFEPDTGPDPDDARDRMIDERLTEKSR